MCLREDFVVCVVVFIWLPFVFKITRLSHQTNWQLNLVLQSTPRTQTLRKDQANLANTMHSLLLPTTMLIHGKWKHYCILFDWAELNFLCKTKGRDYFKVYKGNAGRRVGTQFADCVVQLYLFVWEWVVCSCDPTSSTNITTTLSCSQLSLPNSISKCVQNCTFPVNDRPAYSGMNDDRFAKSEHFP